MSTSTYKSYDYLRLAIGNLEIIWGLIFYVDNALLDPNTNKFSYNKLVTSAEIIAKHDLFCGNLYFRMLRRRTNYRYCINKLCLVI